MGPFTLSPLEMERTFGPTGALGRTRTNSEVTFMDWWLGSRSDKLLSGWYKRSYVLPKYLCTGNYGANHEKECHLRYTMHLYILKFKVSGLISLNVKTRNFSSSLPNKNKTMKVLNNLIIINLMGCISCPWRVPFPGSQLSSLLWRVKNLHTLNTDEVCQLSQRGLFGI